MSAVDARLGDAGDTGGASATVAGAVAGAGGVLGDALAAGALAALQQRIYAAAAQLDVAALKGCVGEAVPAEGRRDGGAVRIQARLHEAGPGSPRAVMSPTQARERADDLGRW